MSKPMLLGMDMLRRIQSVRPDRLVSLWPQNEPVGHGVSTEIVRGYHGAYTATNLGQPGVQGSGLTSAGYDGAASFNNIYTAGLANDNLLLNPGFETAGGAPPIWANWTDTVSDGALANEVVVIHEGIDAAKITAGISTNTRTQQVVALTAGRTYRLRFWTQGDGVNAGQYSLQGTTAPNPWLITRRTTGVSGAAYAMVSDEFTVPAGQNGAALVLWCPPVNGGICYFDACEIRRVDGFLGDKGTVIVPAQVANAGVWTDGVDRYPICFRVDGNNQIYIRKHAAVNRLDLVYEAGNIAEQVTITPHSPTAFTIYGITWDKGAGNMIAYLGGIQTGVPQAIAGTWLGDLDNTRTTIGAYATTPANVYSGNEGPVPLWSEALSADEMRYLG